MENFMISVNAVLPLMLCIGAGYLTRRLNWADDAFLVKCNSFCFKAFLSLMLFTNVYDADLKTAFQPKLVLFTVFSVLAVAAAAFLAVRLLVKDSSSRAVLTQGIFRSNYVIFGIPVAANLYGEGNIATAALLSAVAVPLFNILAVLLLEFYSSGKKTGWKSILKGVVTNPLILGAAAGLFMKLLPFRLPGAVYSAIQDLAGIATPLALVVLGATFRVRAIGPNLKKLLIGVLGKTVIVPIIMIPVAVLCGFRGIGLLSLTILFASPTAVSSFTMAEAAGFDGELAGQQVVFSSICSLLTVFLAIFALKSFALL